MGEDQSSHYVRKLQMIKRLALLRHPKHHFIALHKWWRPRWVIKGISWNASCLNPVFFKPCDKLRLMFGDITLNEGNFLSLASAKKSKTSSVKTIFKKDAYQ